MKAFRIIEREHESGWRELAIEGECEFIDSTEIAVLLLAKRAAPADAPVLVHSARDQVQRVFAVTGLSDDGFL